MGNPPPIDAKATLLRGPGGNAVVTMLTADGKQNEEAAPQRPRMTIICVPFFDSPLASVNAHWRMLPSRYMRRLPATSVTVPTRRSVQPFANA